VFEMKFKLKKSVLMTAMLAASGIISSNANAAGTITFG